MKYLMLVFSLFLVFACNANTQSKVSSSEVVTNTQGGGDAKEEDCEDKAKKPIEIKEDTISLGGSTGCTLDEKETGL
jgi:hypothetical protein